MCLLFPHKHLALTCQTTIPNPINSVKLVENALNNNPDPKPSIAPRLICFTAAGFKVRPSFVSGVFASRECEVLNEEDGVYGDVSRRVIWLGWRKGREAERPNATRMGRARRDRGLGRGCA
jgi:hypothetical protein